MKSSHIQVSSSPVILGASLPISDVITALKAAAEEAPEEYGLVPTTVKKYNWGKTIFFRYCRQLAHHMELVGSRGIRDVGTIGGNLMLRHQVNGIVIRPRWSGGLTQMLLINSSILTFRRTWSPCSLPWRPPWRWCGRRRTARRGCPNVQPPEHHDFQSYHL